MALSKFVSKVSEKQVFGEKFYWLRLELIEPHRLEFVAGQYVIMSIPGHDQKKNYSIASEPEMDHAIDLLVDITPGGIGSQFAQKVEPGETIEFLAPVGGFVVADDPYEEELVFIATGSGITSIRSMVMDLLKTKKDPRKITLYWGLRYAQDLFWEEEFYQLDQEYENFNFELILSRPPEGWKLSEGRVTDLLATRREHYDKTGYYLCGNTKMVEDVKALLYSKSVIDINVHREKYY
jgi:NAD(P)H-flavin reductase